MRRAWRVAVGGDFGLAGQGREDTEKIGYDDRHIDQIVIRMARHFLDRDMRVSFGREWREDGVMRAAADFAAVVTAGMAAEVEERIEGRPGTRA